MLVHNPQSLVSWAFSNGYSSGHQFLSEGDYLAPGSKNLIIDGESIVKAFNGFTSTISIASGWNSIQTFNFDQTHAELFSASVAKGSVFMLTSGKTMAFIGVGNLAQTGIPLLDASAVQIAASSSLQFLLLRSGSYSGAAANGPYVAGQLAPSAPAVGAVTYGYGVGVPLTNKTLGTVSARTTRVRSATGGESNASEPSAVIAMPADGGALRITLPAAGSGQDRWGIYVSLSGFGLSGPHFFLMEVTEAAVTATRTTSADVNTTSGSTTITSATGAFTAADVGRVIVVTQAANTLSTYITRINSGTSVEVNAAPAFTTAVGVAVVTQAVDGVLRSIAVEWTDADLIGATFAPIDSDPPPAGWFGFTLGDCTAIVGCYGDTVSSLSATNIGNVIAVSQPGFPEAYPADNLLFLPEAPTCIVDRSSEGFVFIFGLNSLSVVSYTGSSGLPLALQTVWNTTGCANAWNTCMVDGKLHVINGTGLVRMGDGGEPDVTWTQDVAVDLRSYNPSASVLTYDANWKQLMIAENNQALCYSLLNGRWGAPLDFTTFVTAVNPNARSAVTINGASLIWLGNGGAAKLCSFNVGQGSTWIALSGWKGGPNLMIMSQVRGSFRTDDITTNKTITLRAYSNFNTATPAAEWTQIATQLGGNPLLPGKRNVRNCRALALYMSGISAGSTSNPAGPIQLQGAGMVSSMMV